jgi:hypothetical protein
MAVTIIEIRTRATVNDAWSAWSNLPIDSVTDGTFTHTDLVQYRMQSVVTIDSVTNATTVANGVTNGTGVFDVLMDSINLQVNSDYELGRLKGTDYATVRLGTMQAALQQAITFVLQKPLLEKQVASEEAKRLLVERQTKGFDDDAKQKLLKQALDSWSVAYSVAKDANAIPDTIKVNPIDSIMKSAMDALAITNTINPLGEA